MRAYVAARRILADAFGHFYNDDGWAIASHVALTSLMAMFPFLIFVSALAAMTMGTTELAEEVARILLETLPERIALSLATEIHTVLTVPRGDLLTVGILLAIWFASNGVEALRTALNRAYRMKETRSVFLLRTQSIIFVLLGAGGVLALAFLVVLAPLGWATAVKWMPWLAPFAGKFTLVRIGAASVILLVGLFVSHGFLPAGRRPITQLWPGILATLVLWLIAGAVFGAYLETFANYVSTYAGLAGAMTALVFLYLVAALFILGGELNAAILRYRAVRAGIRRIDWQNAKEIPDAEATAGPTLDPTMSQDEDRGIEKKD
ncbi:MAG: hypothetical protein C0606_09880 [Hyphomicrobiales bacterium]|nr:MAG: hypothetical protein C0606_09880 [Hyphomicrobiales bacterium]